MSNNLYINFTNKINTSILNKKTNFFFKNSKLNKKIITKLNNLKNSNLLRFKKKSNNSLLISFNFYNNKIPFKNFNKWK